MSSAPALKRGIKFRDLALFYVVVALSIRWTATAAAAGPSILVVWIAALICFFIPLAASVMELSSRYPQEGGLYVWTREAFGDFAGFMCAWLYWMSCLPLFPALLYFGAASTLFAFGARARALAASPAYFIIFSVVALLLITVLNIRGVDVGKWLNNIGSLGTFVPLTVLVVLAAISWLRFGPETDFTRAAMTPHWSFENAVFWSGVFFAFAGIEAASAMGDEIQNPRRNIPWALLVGGSLLTLGYIAGTVALLVALPSTAVGGPDGFVNGIRMLTDRLGVGWILAPMAILVALSSFGNTAANLSSLARLPFVAGVDRYLPPVFGSIHPRYQTPWVAIGVYGVAGMIVALLGQAGTSVRGAYNVLVSMGVISLFFPYLFLFGSMIRLQSRPAGPEIRRVPGGRPTAFALGVVGFLSCSITIVLSVIPGGDEINKPLAVAKVLGSTLLLAVGGGAVFLFSKLKAKQEATRVLDA